MKTFIVIMKDLNDNILSFKIKAPNRQILHDSSMKASSILLNRMLCDGYMFGNIPGSELKKYSIVSIEELDYLYELDYII